MRKAVLVVLVAAAVLALAAYLFAGRILASGAVRSAIEQQLSQYLGQPVQIGSASVALFPRVALELRAVSIGAPPAAQFGEMRLVTGLRPLLSRTIQDAELVVADTRLTLPLPFTLGSSGPSAPSPEGGQALRIASIRTITLRDVDIVAGAHTVRVQADSSIHGDRLAIVRLSARAAKTRFEASGELTSVARLQGVLDARADPLDLDETIAIGAALADTSAPAAAAGAAAPPPFRLTVKLAAPSGQIAAQPFRGLSTTLDLVPGSMTLDPLAVETFGGSFRGRLAADTRRAVPQLRLTGRADGLDVVALMKTAGSPGGITGRLGGTLTLSGEGTESAALMRSARGTIAAAITDGAIPGLDMVRPIVLAFGKPSGAPPEGSGSSFSRLGGTFALANGTLTSSDLAMASRDFDMAGRGTVELVTGSVSARVDVVLSAELTSQAGTDLRRYAQQDGRVVVPATVGGTLQRPSVTLDLAAATRRALGNELQRRTKSFIEGLFKKKD